jgi:hypothetical protein
MPKRLVDFFTRSKEILAIVLCMAKNVGLEALTTHIRRQLEKRGLCVVFETDLERCWPSEKIASTERERRIQAFAESQGWAAVILAAESGARAIFQTRQPSPELQLPCNYVSSEMQIWTLDMPK